MTFRSARPDALPRRLLQLWVGLTLYGISIALMVRAGLGTMPWSVLEVGLAHRLGMDLGTVIVVVSVVVVLLWIPLRQRPGFGTLANTLWVGPATGMALALIPAQSGPWWSRAPMLLGGVVLNAVAGGLYIGSRLGPGPRDGLMTGLHARTGVSLRLVRSAIEITVVGLGFCLGGVVGIGTILYALTIGPATQFFLGLFTVPAATRDAPVSAVVAEDRGVRPVPADCAQAE